MAKNKLWIIWYISISPYQLLAHYTTIVNNRVGVDPVPLKAYNVYVGIGIACSTVVIP
jgi:hypothetical protein